MKKVGKNIKVSKSKNFEISTLSFSGCMKKIGKVIKVLRRKSFEMSILSFSGGVREEN